MITNKINITVPVYLINLDNVKDKRLVKIIIKKEDVEKLIFKDSVGKNIPVDISFKKDCIVHSKITLSMKKSDGEIGFIVQSPDTRYTIIDNTQTMLNLKAEYIKSEMIEKYTQILNMDTEALSNIEFKEVEDDDYDKIEVRPI